MDLMKKCGNCQFTRALNEQKLVECLGHPPTVLMIGAGQDPLGRTAYQLEFFSPRVEKSRPPCSLHRFKLEGPTSFLETAKAEGNG